MTRSMQRGMTVQPSVEEPTLRPLPRSGRRGRLLGGFLVVVVSAALAAYLFVAVAHRATVLMVARNVPVGSRLQASDLSSVQVSVDAAVQTVPAGQSGQVVGRYAAVDLRAGELLAPSEVTAALSPGRGQQVVSLGLKAGQMPPDLQPGYQVLIVATPGAPGQSAGGGQAQALTRDVAATVDRVTAPDESGVTVVNVLVPADVGPLVARQASTSQVALVVTARRS
jgi:hypothetical protein